MGVKEDGAQEILSHILGIKSGPTLFEGLVVADDDCQFKAKLAIVKDPWANICEKEGMSLFIKLCKHCCCKYVEPSWTCCYPW